MRSLFALSVAALVVAPSASFAAAKKAPPEAKATDPKPAEPKADAKKATALQEIKKLGLAFQGPKAEYSDMGDQVMVQAPGLVFTVGPAGEFAPKSFEEAKGAKNDYSPTRVTKQEKTADGWNIQFQNKGAMGENFFVWIRRTIGGKQIQCETNVSNADQAAAAEEACLSLTKK